MCEQCCAETDSYGEVLDGWYLVRATVQGTEMRPDQWGLVRTCTDDPLYIWTETPTPLVDQTKDFAEGTSLHSDAMNDWIRWMAKALAFGRFFQIDADMGWCLVEAARKRGYSFDDKPFYEWFYNHLGEWIRDHEPVTHDQARDSRRDARRIQPTNTTE